MMIRRWDVWTAFATLLLGLGIARADDKVLPTADENAAIARIRSSGGQVCELAQNDSRLEVAFYLADGKITDEQLLPLKDLPRIAILNLRGRDITNDGLVNLKDLKGLLTLHLERTKISDDGLQHLKGLEKLEYLNLYGTQVSDAGLKHLYGLKKLKRLYVWQTNVTPAGIAEIKAALPGLQVTQGIELPKAEDPPKEEEKKPEEKKP